MDEIEARGCPKKRAALISRRIFSDYTAGSRIAEEYRRFYIVLSDLYLNVSWEALQASKAHGAIIGIDSVIAAEYLSSLQALLQLSLIPVAPEACLRIWRWLICEAAGLSEHREGILCFLQGLQRLSKCQGNISDFFLDAECLSWESRSYCSPIKAAKCVLMGCSRLSRCCSIEEDLVALLMTAQNPSSWPTSLLFMIFLTMHYMHPY